ncbi:hypothetical protein V6N12_003818 [Hibiscus sabdariffa]|uniref:FRIGIDA-like protein n=1 Tax=Hibiscus sabdariffa TaxID=183260 RepID=A0ABR2CJM5_9ROSI
MSSENIPSLRTIESAIELIDVKKDQLKKAFEDLPANSLHLFSFSISWPLLDAHFTAIQNSVTQRLHILHSRESLRNPIDDVPVSKQGDPPAPNPLTEQDTDSMVNQPLNQRVPLNVEKPSSSPELKDFCERMDGKGLRKYIYDRVKERDAIRMELPGALKSAADPGAMVLDAMEGFYTENSQSEDDTEPGLLELRRVCVVLLEQLIETGISINEDVRERAKKLALEWKGKVRLLKDNSLETLAFLHLVATYSLGPLVDKEELVDHFFTIAQLRQATVLCRSIGIGDKVHADCFVMNPLFRLKEFLSIEVLISSDEYGLDLCVADLIQKLLDDGKQLLAVKFIFEFGLVEKFPPGPLLEKYLEETKRHAMQVCEKGNNSLKSQNIATDSEREIGALKSVIKIIEEHNLETEYSLEPLQKCIEQLEKQQADRKAAATPAAFKLKQQKAVQKARELVARQAKRKREKQVTGTQQQSGNKHPKTTASVVRAVSSSSAAGTTPVILPFQQVHLHPAGLWPIHSAAYLRSPAPMYGLAGAPMSFP